MVTPQEIARAMAVHSFDDDTRTDDRSDEADAAINGTSVLPETDEPTSDVSGNGKLPRKDHEEDAGHGVVADVKETASKDTKPSDDPEQ